MVRNVNSEAKTSIKGILPCPVRMQFVEKFEEFVHSQDYEINYNLNAVSMGMDVVEDEIVNAKTEDDLSEVYMSAGFSLFFDKDHMGKFRGKGIFKDYRKDLNKDFDNDEISLKDPRGEYSIIGVVPAIFIVNRDKLGNRKKPTCWEDLFKPEFDSTSNLGS